MSNTIPAGWSIKRLGDLVDIRSSNVDKKSYELDQPVQLCNYTDVYYNNKITRGLSFMVATAKGREIERFTLEKDDVIITKDSETPDDIAVPAYVPDDLPGVICGYHLTLLKPFKDRSSGHFLSHLFQLSSVQHYFYILANGTTRFGLTADAINGAPLATPPLPEQQKIATILSSVDDVIEKTRAQIDKLKDLKTGLMQELLTQGISHTEFKDSPVGRIPASWECSDLSTVLELIVDCEHKTAPYVEISEFLVVRTSNVRDGELVFEDMRCTDLNSYQMWTQRAVPKHRDILFTREAPAGESCMVPEGLKLCMGQRMVLLRPDKKRVLAEFLSLLLNSDIGKQAIYDLSIGTTVMRINIEDIKKIPCLLPTLDEQEKINQCIGSVSWALSNTRQQLRQVINIKQALMQDLLTGKVRVTVTDKEVAVA